MHLVYLGQSGTTGISADDPSQPHEVVAGLMLHETQTVSLNGEFDALCRRQFGAPLGESGAPRHIRPVDLFQGLRHYSSWPPERRSEMIQDCLNILIRRETPVLSAFLNKRDLIDARATASSPAALLSTNPIEPVMSRFLFALSLFLDEMSLATLNHDQIMSGQLPVSQFAMVVAQERANIEPRLLAEFLRSDEGMDASAIHENICFVNAEDSPGMQLANLCAYFTRRWLQTPNNPNPYFEVLRDNKVIQVLYPVAL